jgi:hypothetical protein
MRLEAIIASEADFSGALDRITAAMQETVKEFDQDFQKTTRTWKRRPRFQKKVTAQTDRVIGEAWTENVIYHFVSGGTRVRYATMTPDFVAKTRTGWVGSRPGRGGLLYVNKNRPRPGIKARKFPEAIAKKQFPYYVRRMDNCMRQVARDSGHAA